MADGNITTIGVVNFENASGTAFWGKDGVETNSVLREYNAFFYKYRIISVASSQQNN